MQSYKKYSRVDRWLLNYGNPLIATVGKTKSLPMDAIEDINIRDGQTEELI